jgi:hypothetical protein
MPEMMFPADSSRAGPGTQLFGAKAMVKAGNVLLAGYTLAQCVLLLLLAKYVSNPRLATCD